MSKSLSNNRKTKFIKLICCYENYSNSLKQFAGIHSKGIKKRQSSSHYSRKIKTLSNWRRSHFASPLSNKPSSYFSLFFLKSHEINIDFAQFRTAEECLMNSANTPFSFIKEWRKAMKRRFLCLHHQTSSASLRFPFFSLTEKQQRWLQMLQFSFCEISIIHFPINKKKKVKRGETEKRSAQESE